MSEPISETTPAESAPTEGTMATPDPVLEAQSVDDLPHWAQTELRKIRNDAARYRQKAKFAADEARSQVERDHADQLTELTQQRDEAQQQLDTERLSRRKLTAALNVGVKPESAEEFASRLQGDSDEELAEDAQRLKTTLGSSTSQRRSDPAQGAQATTPGSGFPLADWIQTMQ